MEGPSHPPTSPAFAVMPFQQTQAFAHARSYLSLEAIIWPVKSRTFRVKRICYNAIHTVILEKQNPVFENYTQKISGIRGWKRRVRASNSNELSHESTTLTCVQGADLELRTWRLPQWMLTRDREQKQYCWQLAEKDVSKADGAQYGCWAVGKEPHNWGAEGSEGWGAPLES